MKKAVKHVTGLVALIAGVAAGAATSAVLQAHGTDAADPRAAVTPTRYESFLPARAVKASDVSPADNWKSANRTVGSFDSMGLAMDSESAAAPSPTPPAPHAPSGNTLAPAAPDAHAGHKMPPAAPHPHAGHTLSPAVPAPHTGHEDKEKK